MHLYELADERRNIIEGAIDYETGEFTLDEEKLAALDLRIEDKAVACTMVSDEKRKLATAKRERARVLTEQARMLEAQADRLDDYTIHQLEQCGGIVDLPDMRVSVGKSSSVEVIDEGMIPAEYMREKVTRTPDKKKIADAIKGGDYVPGAAIIQKKHLRVR